ncbi:LytTR family DNA-binding domain-containing protein [Pedobacter sp. JY14-1]|uniref:LytR/AlgR family response regulator transcription factor n=1 Tax=Pedobacter sp. JY14-1 TaxID=3034151 RepID=UPI0023E1E4FC|nr:LytTR family DNA-binding domain-containing protein [Pedobacter sp. JY14-1]
MNAIIVDDEEFARSSLYFLLQEHCGQVNILGIAKSVAEARTLLQQSAVDLIFLDIAMPGENGFDLIPAIKQAGAYVIFTTAYDQYALKAIKANALDYLLKPIDIDELTEAVGKAEKVIGANKGEQPQAGNLQNLAASLSDKAEPRKISLPNGQGYSLVSIDDIVHIEADSNYSVFYFTGREQITVSKVLKEYEEILPQDQFIRIHKSSIVNLNYIKEYNYRNGYEVLMKNGEKIAVSRRRASDLAEKLRIYTS